MKELIGGGVGDVPASWGDIDTAGCKERLVGQPAMGARICGSLKVAGFPVTL